MLFLLKWIEIDKNITIFRTILSSVLFFNLVLFVVFLVLIQVHCIFPFLLFCAIFSSLNPEFGPESKFEPDFIPLMTETRAELPEFHLNFEPSHLQCARITHLHTRVYTSGRPYREVMYVCACARMHTYTHTHIHMHVCMCILLKVSDFMK